MVIVRELKKYIADLFGFEKGFLIFHRDGNGEIRDFKLENQDVGLIMGSLFVKK